MSDVHSTGALRQQPEAVDQDRVISGPAFPSSNSPETGYYAEGMTLLDYFAARAPLEIMLSQTVAQEGWGSARHIAVASFDYAEAMVAESFARQTASGSHQEARSNEQGERSLTPLEADLVATLRLLDARLRQCIETPASAADAYDSFYQAEVAAVLEEATGEST